MEFLSAHSEAIWALAFLAILGWFGYRALIRKGEHNKRLFGASTVVRDVLRHDHVGLPDSKLDALILEGIRRHNAFELTAFRELAREVIGHMMALDGLPPEVALSFDRALCAYERGLMKAAA